MSHASWACSKAAFLPLSVARSAKSGHWNAAERSATGISFSKSVLYSSFFFFLWLDLGLSPEEGALAGLGADAGVFFFLPED